MAGQDTKRDNLDEIMRQITELGEYTAEYHEALAFLLTIMAKRQWIIADQIRTSHREHEARAARRAALKAAKQAAQERS